MSPETQAAFEAGMDAVAKMVAARADLVTLTSFMADCGDYGVDDVAYAVAKPWKYADVLAEAKAALTSVTL